MNVPQPTEMSDPTIEDRKLLQAIREGDLFSVKEYVEQWRENISAAQLTNSHLRQPLVEALVANQSQIASYLLDQGAKLDSHNVTLAPIKESSTQMFQVFLDHGWDINSITSNDAPRLK